VRTVAITAVTGQPNCSVSASPALVTGATVNGTGGCTIAFAAGTFSQRPVCTSTVERLPQMTALIEAGTSASQLEFILRDDVGGTADALVRFTCVGLR
jgi:hypothetical protein